MEQPEDELAWLMVIMLPTWLITLCMQPFLPPTHEWYKKKISLMDWAMHATQLNYEFSVFFWVNGLVMITSGIILWQRA